MPPASLRDCSWLPGRSKAQVPKDKIIEHLFLTSWKVNGGGCRETSKDTLACLLAIVLPHQGCLGCWFLVCWFVGSLVGWLASVWWLNWLNWLKWLRWSGAREISEDSLAWLFACLLARRCSPIMPALVVWLVCWFVGSSVLRCVGVLVGWCLVVELVELVEVAELVELVELAEGSATSTSSTTSATSTTSTSSATKHQPANTPTRHRTDEPTN